MGAGKVDVHGALIFLGEEHLWQLRAWCLSLWTTFPVKRKPLVQLFPATN